MHGPRYRTFRNGPIGTAAPGLKRHPCPAAIRKACALGRAAIRVATDANVRWLADPFRMELVTGNRLTALGALSAGCRFFAGYPITPSSEIYRTMMEELPRRGGLALSAPDEISALAACVGASLAGYPAMTATSGPGFCLMIETVQYAVMTETPVVIALVQRLGPSTGGATQGAQGDVLLAEYCTSGGYTIPVFAPVERGRLLRAARAGRSSGRSGCARRSSCSPTRRSG